MQVLNLIKGDTLLKRIKLTVNKAPLNITGYTFYLTIKPVFDNVLDDSTAVVKKDWTDHADPIDGVTLLQATSSEMFIEVGQYVADIQYKGTVGNIKTLCIFTLNITPNVTNRTS
jgi:hypothetical protein